MWEGKDAPDVAHAQAGPLRDSFSGSRSTPAIPLASAAPQEWSAPRPTPGPGPSNGHHSAHGPQQHYAPGDASADGRRKDIPGLGERFGQLVIPIRSPTLCLVCALVAGLR